MSKNICPNCGTENEERYQYCKNCGTFLEDITENTDTQSSYGEGTAYREAKSESSGTYQYTGGYNGFSGGFNSAIYPETVGGVPAEDMVLFIGKKSEKILPKFVKEDITHSKVDWCWPAAVLGLIFGPFGSAFWFFYRKMYKIGIIFASVGAAVILLSSVLNVIFGGDTQADAEIRKELLDILGNTPQMSEALSEISFTASLISNLVTNVFSLASCIVGGIFGYHFYFNDARTKIFRYRNSNADMRYYRFALSSIGGTSGGMLVLMIFIFLTVNSVIPSLVDLVLKLF